MTPQKIIVLPDEHLEDEDRRAINASYEYIHDERPDRIIRLGDVLDFGYLTNKASRKRVESCRIKNTYDYLKKNLARLQKAGRGCPIDWIEGNHDYRVKAYIEEHPETEGMLEITNSVDLEKYGVNFIPFWTNGKGLRIGKALFIHGRFVSDGHAKKTVMEYGENVFYGHTHDIDCYSLTSAGSNKTRVGQSLGTLQRYHPKWMRGRPDDWQQAVTTFYFDSKGYFQYYISRIFNGRFIAPNGKEYQG